MVRVSTITVTRLDTTVSGAAAIVLEDVTGAAAAVHVYGGGILDQRLVNRMKRDATPPGPTLRAGMAVQLGAQFRDDAGYAVDPAPVTATLFTRSGMRTYSGAHVKSDSLGAYSVETTLMDAGPMIVQFTGKNMMITQDYTVHPSVSDALIDKLHASY